ncbi:unnamed protein product [Withania somnifera]
MAMGHERSKPLHNFTLPCGLRWGNQKFLRCAKVDSNGQIVRRSNGSELIGRRRRADGVIIGYRRSNGVKETEVSFSRKLATSAGYGGGGDGGGDGIAAVREKLLFDLQAEADKMKYAIFRDGLTGKEVYTAPTPADGFEPWNLRTRRAACKAPINGIGSGGGGGGGGSNGNVKVDVGSSALRLRSELSGAGDGDFCAGETRKRASFSVSLSRREIEEDFMEMVGHRSSRRPKKRAKIVQKNIDTLFPGLWLTEITPDLYKVPDDQ